MPGMEAKSVWAFRCSHAACSKEKSAFHRLTGCGLAKLAPKMRLGVFVKSSVAIFHVFDKGPRAQEQSNLGTQP